MSSKALAPAPADKVIVVDELVTAGTYNDYQPSAIRASYTNRKRFNEQAMVELAASIKEQGVVQPILIRPVAPTDAAPEAFEIVAGERRWRATIMAGVATIPAVCRTLTDLQAVKIQILENLQREDPHPLEEAEGYEQLMQKHGYNADQLADEVKKSRSYIYGRLKLCALSTSVREQFLDNQISASTALLIARIPVPALQVRALDEITRPPNYNVGSTTEPMSYRRASAHIQRHYMLDLSEAIFLVSDAKLLASAGACTKCPKRTGNQPEVFSDVSADVCTDPDCFDEKRAAHHARTIVLANRKGIPVFEGDEARDHLQNQFVTNSEFVTEITPLRAFQRNAPATKNEGALGDHLQCEAMPQAAAYAKDNDGDVIALYRRADTQIALEKAGICETVPVHAARMKALTTTPEAPDKKAQAKDAANKAAQDLHLKRVAAAARATTYRVAVYRQFRERAANGLSLESLREFVKFIVCDDNNYALPSDLLDLYGLEHHSDIEVCKFIDTATLPTVQLVLLDIVMGESLGVQAYDVSSDCEVEANEGFETLLAMAKHEGIDAAKVARQEKVRGLAIDEVDPLQVYDFIDMFPDRINELAAFILKNGSGQLVTAMEMAAKDLGYQYRGMNDGGYIKCAEQQQPATDLPPANLGEDDLLADVMPEASASTKQPAVKPSTKAPARKIMKPAPGHASKSAPKAKTKAPAAKSAKPAAPKKASAPVVPGVAEKTLKPAVAWPFPEPSSKTTKADEAKQAAKPQIDAAWPFPKSQAGK